ncbi:hypothetical protein L208DRAFT_1386002 [Tricholoma matsutake]|nr:hypothetical protein L208DRAFT_1386002 [Tricholoma matsutake 945]
MARTLLSMPEALLLGMVPSAFAYIPSRSEHLVNLSHSSAAVAAAATYTFDPVTTPTSIFNAAVTTSNPSTSAVVRPASATSSSSPNTTRNAAPELKANTALLGALAGVMAILV